MIGYIKFQIGFVNVLIELSKYYLDLNNVMVEKLILISHKIQSEALCVVSFLLRNFLIY